MSNIRANNTIPSRLFFLHCQTRNQYVVWPLHIIIMWASMNYNNSDIDSTINYTPYKNAIDNNIDLFPNTTINEYTDMKYVHEHFLKYMIRFY